MRARYCKSPPTFVAHSSHSLTRSQAEDTPEEQQEFLEKLWAGKGFSLWLGGYKDYLFNADSNRIVYVSAVPVTIPSFHHGSLTISKDFWRKKQSPRISDPRKKEILFPEQPPHAFGIKRPCLEQNYYEVLARDNVDIVNINADTKYGTPIQEFTENGIITSDGQHREYDIIALATGFDVVTGGMTSMGLKSVNGTYLQDEWKAAANTYLGTTISGYPNLFHLYGPHGPTLLSNGPSSVEIQGRWIRDAIKQITKQNLKYIDPTPEASKEWKKRINDLAEPTLFPTTKSTYMGGTVPGKANEMTCYAGGVGTYNTEIRGKLAGFQGFETVKA